MAPLLALLPAKSQVNKLEGLSSFFYARFERVNAILVEAAMRPEEPPPLALQAERAMLQQILDWLEITPAEVAGNVGGAATKPRERDGS